MGQTIEKLLRNGTRISTEAHEIVRIPGLLTDADMIGGPPPRPAGGPAANWARWLAGRTSPLAACAGRRRLPER